ncbi:MAG TPA: hypothetical protein VEJ43_06460 [Pseudolabrys sp.]|nr:hypothetical protein [Pseudolabrys sp.]
MLEQFFDRILSEVRVIADAPLIFATAVLVLGMLIWAALKSRYARIIEQRNHLIALYKARLNGATPDEARAKMDSLEGQVVSLKSREWTKLHPAAVTEFETSLAPQGSRAVSVLPQDRDSAFLARDLVDAFKRIGWKAKRDASTNGIPDGISVWPDDDVARAISNALMMATGAVVTVREDQHLKDQGGYAIGIGNKPD